MIWVALALVAVAVIVYCADRFIGSMNPLDVENDEGADE